MGIAFGFIIGGNDGLGCRIVHVPCTEKLGFSFENLVQVDS